MVPAFSRSYLVLVKVQAGRDTRMKNTEDFFGYIQHKIMNTNIFLTSL